VEYQTRFTFHLCGGQLYCSLPPRARYLSRRAVSSIKNVAPSHYAYIDALRGYAILGVIAVHTGQNVPALRWPLRDLAASGRYGVQLFFVVSALTLMMSWHARSGGIYSFYIRRFFRIAPMFWLAIPLYCAIDGFGPRTLAPDGLSWREILLTITFLHGWYPESINSVVPGGWSIAVETTFYACFPALMVGLRLCPRAGLAFFLSFVLSMIMNSIANITLSLTAPNLPEVLVSAFKSFWFFNQLPVFFVGINVFFALQKIKPSVVILRRCLIFTLVVLILLPYIKILPGNIEYALCFGALTFCLGSGAGGPLVNAVICQIGKISYSCYLWHFAVLELCAWILMKYTSGLEGLISAELMFVIMFVAVTCITAVLSKITYKLIEQPMIAFGNRIAIRATASTRFQPS